MSIEIQIPRYTLIKEIGSGGMAIVYLATQEDLNRTVAIKLLRQNLSGSNEEFKKRFMHEGRMLAQLEHENIVKIYDIGSTEDCVYMAMEYLKGGTLSQRMQSGPVSVGDVIKICAKVAMALNVAHSKNIIHRDLKPSNIMFRDPTTPVLTDFGIARKIDLDMTLTATGMMIGTPQYMSPEQVQGKSVDARSDIYSLGLMFYRLLTGELPFKATEPIALAMQQIQDPPPPLPARLAELQPVMDLMLAKNPADRYQSTLDFCNHLRSISLTDEDYATELTEATRVFNSSEFSAPRIRLSSQTQKPPSRESSAVSSAISSLIKTTTGRKKTRYALLASLALIVAAVLFFSIFNTSGITEDEKRRIAHELRKFNAYLVSLSIYSPEGENATDSLRKMMEIAPEYGDVLDAASNLANYYEGDALELYSEDRLDEALALLNSALEFAPENSALLDRKQTVSAAIEERERLRKIEALLAGAERSMQQGNLLPPGEDNAYQAFKSVLELNSQNEQAQAGLSAIQVSIVKQAKSAWTAGNAEEAKVALRQAEQFFGASTHISSLKEEIAEAEREAAEQQRLQDLLQQAETQFALGKLVEPAQDNALESYQSMLALQPGQAAAASGLEKIAEFYLAEARQFFQQEQYELSLESAARGLKALPQNEGLLLAQSEATSRLDARSREIQTRLQKARRLVDSGQFIPGLPAGEGASENAYDTFKSVEEIDPGNAQANSGLAQLPNKIFLAVQAYERAGELDQALILLYAAKAAYADETRFSAKAVSIEALLAERELRQGLLKKLQAVDQMIGQRPMTVGLIEQIAQALREISTEFPNEVSVSDRLTDFITAIDGEAGRLSRMGQEDDALAMTRQALELYPANQRLKGAQTAIRQSKRDREAAEKKRIAAMSGVLAIDASPWARVMEVRNRDKVLQDLPGNAETPLVLNLQEGEYTVQVAGTDTDRSLALTVQVKRQQVVMARADLSLMTAEVYFEKSNW